MARFAKVEYDKEHDVLYVGYGKKVEDSLKVGDFVIDFSKGDEMVGVEVFDASKAVKDLNQAKISKDMLSKFTVAQITTSRMRELMFFVVALYISANNRSEKLLLQVPNVAALN
ncbi:MAG: DUF2283 domain-containing protein [Candidatus Micrarchaeota archaeon]|nr:DUF2283 domain-containing protein [Candidatus Micrarchaeota archaeon]